MQGANGDERGVQPAQPRGRRRRRRLLRALPRHDVRAGAGRSALEDACPRSARFDDACGRAGLALLALAAPAAASAAQPRLAALPSPLAALSATPPLGSGASAAAEGVRHRIDATTRVRVAVDAHGTPFAVTATQRLDVSQPGDYYFTIGAPLTDVAPRLRLAVDAGAAHRDDHLGRVQPRQARARSARDARPGCRRGLAAASRLDRRRQGDARERDGDHDDRIRRRRAQAATRDVPRRAPARNAGRAVRRRAVARS